MESGGDTKWCTVLSSSGDLLYYYNAITGEQRYVDQDSTASCVQEDRAVEDSSDTDLCLADVQPKVKVSEVELENQSDDVRNELDTKILNENETWEKRDHDKQYLHGTDNNVIDGLNVCELPRCASGAEENTSFNSRNIKEVEELASAQYSRCEMDAAVTEERFPVEQTFNKKQSAGTLKNGSVERETGILNCAYCNKPFTERGMIRHVRGHKFKKPFQCKHCDKSFAKEESLSQHEVIHTNNRPFQCPDCFKRFTLKSNLVQHQRIHTLQKPHECTDCGKSFTQKSNLVTHLRIHTVEKPFKCNQCEKCFALEERLLGHLRSHMKNTSYRCPHCGKSFIQKSNLNQHLRIHTKEKPFVCSHCGKTFSQKSNLVTHLTIHKAEKPFQCTECTKYFKLKQHLTSHLRTHSKEEAPLELQV